MARTMKLSNSSFSLSVNPSRVLSIADLRYSSHFTAVLRPRSVRQTAKELGYVPNVAARALKTNHSYNIGVLFEEQASSGLTHEYFSGVLNGLKLQIEQQHYDLTFINTSFENSEMTYLDHAKYRNFAAA